MPRAAVLSSQWGTEPDGSPCACWFAAGQLRFRSIWRSTLRWSPITMPLQRGNVIQRLLAQRAVLACFTVAASTVRRPTGFARPPVSLRPPSQTTNGAAQSRRSLDRSIHVEPPPGSHCPCERAKGALADRTISRYWPLQHARNVYPGLLVLLCTRHGLESPPPAGRAVDNSIRSVSISARDAKSAPKAPASLFAIQSFRDTGGQRHPDRPSTSRSSDLKPVDRSPIALRA